MLTWDQVEFGASLSKDQEDHSYDERIISPKDITILDVFVPSSRGSK